MQRKRPLYATTTNKRPHHHNPRNSSGTPMPSGTAVVSMPRPMMPPDNQMGQSYKSNQPPFLSNNTHHNNPTNQQPPSLGMDMMSAARSRAPNDAPMWNHLPPPSFHFATSGGERPHDSHPHNNNNMHRDPNNDNWVPRPR